MPHDYFFAMRTQTGTPGFLTFRNDGTVHPDTASSQDAVQDEYSHGDDVEFGHLEAAKVQDSGAADSISRSVFLARRNAEETPSCPRGHIEIIDLESRKALGECAEAGLTRDLTASSGTCAAVTIAAEIALRTMGKLKKDEFLSVAALEVFTTLLTARKSLSTIYNTLKVAQQTGFLREADVDPLTSRFSGRVEEWKAARFNLVDYIVLNDASATDFKFSFSKVNHWLAKGRPVLARVDPVKLVVADQIDKAKLNGKTHHTVVIIGRDGDDYVVRTGWKHRPILRMNREAPSEGWGFLFEGEVPAHTHAR